MIDEIIKQYTDVVRSLFAVTAGGTIRAKKGAMVESIAEQMIRAAWAEIGGEEDRLTFSSETEPRKVRVPLKEDYIPFLPQAMQDKIQEGEEFFYDIHVDVPAYIDDNFVLGVECKAFTENAMLKRILVDFFLIKTLYPELKCCLLQLETQLGGSNSRPGDFNITNKSTPTIMSYFPGVDLKILTLLEGERNIDEPIHRKEHFKEMKPEFVRYAIEQIKELLRPYK